MADKTAVARMGLRFERLGELDEAIERMVRAGYAVSVDELRRGGPGDLRSLECGGRFERPWRRGRSWSEVGFVMASNLIGLSLLVLCPFTAFSVGACGDTSSGARTVPADASGGSGAAAGLSPRTGGVAGEARGGAHAGGSVPTGAAGGSGGGAASDASGGVPTGAVGGSGGGAASDAPAGGGGEGGAAVGGSPPTSDPWWDEAISATAPTGEFLFVGRDAVTRGDQCIYRYLPAAAPQPLFCPPLADMSSGVQIAATEQPRADQASFLVVVTQTATDRWPEELYRVQVATGEAERLSTFDSAPEGGPFRSILGVLSVDEERYAALIDGEDGLELLVGSGELEFGTGLAVPGFMGSLRGVLAPNHVAVRTDETLLLVDVGGSAPLVASERQTVGLGDLSPDGRFVSWFTEYGSSVGVLSTTAEARLALTTGYGGPPGWIDASSLLVFDAGEYYVWHHLADELELLPRPADYPPRGSFRRSAGAVAFVTTTADATSPLEGIGWYSAGSFAPQCGNLERVRTIATVEGDPAPVALFDDAEVLGGAWFFSKIYSCRPGGDPIDLLSAHGLHGRLLPPNEWPLE